MNLEPGKDPSLLIVDDDERLAQRLAQAIEKRGFAVSLALSVADGDAWRPQKSTSTVRYAAAVAVHGDGTWARRRGRARPRRRTYSTPWRSKCSRLCPAW